MAAPAPAADAPPSVPVLGPALAPALPEFTPALPLAAADSGGRQRPRAIEYSDLYGIRLEVHRYASYATLPLFAAEYVLGSKLYGKDSTSASLRQAHSLVAAGIYGLFGLNTVTGGWNLWDARKDPADRTRRYVHAAMMFASDVGFLVTASTAPGGRLRRAGGTALADRERIHRAWAISSFSLATAGYLMMLIWKN